VPALLRYNYPPHLLTDICSLSRHLLTYTHCLMTSQTSRFDKHGSYSSKSTTSDPGPGAYSPPHHKGDTKSYTASGAPPPSLQKGRCDFGPAGEGVAAMYEVKSSFDSPVSKRGPTSCFGSSKRFEGAGAYSNPTASPGPGAYNSRAEVLKRSAPRASFASPRMRPPGWTGQRPRSALNSSSSSYLR